MYQKQNLRNIAKLHFVNIAENYAYYQTGHIPHTASYELDYYVMMLCSMSFFEGLWSYYFVIKHMNECMVVAMLHSVYLLILL